jgi:5-methylcytosine-specific restriction endonuclease McrA
MVATIAYEVCGLAWNVADDSAWFKVDSQTYRHYCGSSLSRHGSLWSANAVAGTSVTNHPTALQAVASLQKNDRSFWTFGAFGPDFGSIQYGGFHHRFRPVMRKGDKDEVFIFRICEGRELPKILKSLLERHFLNKASCVRCLSLMTQLQTRALPQFDATTNEQNIYLTCVCGFPVWQMEMVLYSTVQSSMQKNAIEWHRSEKLKAAGGKHTSEEIERILEIQSGRCIYCNKNFTDERRPTKDHLLSITHGGSSWALNIIMACRSCNSSRGSLPFRSYCKLLSPAANKRILAHLKKRLQVLDLDNLPEEFRRSFEQGIALHDTKHYRYQEGARESERQNARKNRLLPGTIQLIMKK